MQFPNRYVPTFFKYSKMANPRSLILVILSTKTVVKNIPQFSVLFNLYFCFVQNRILYDEVILVFSTVGTKMSHFLCHVVCCAIEIQRYIVLRPSQSMLLMHAEDFGKLGFNFSVDIADRPESFNKCISCENFVPYTRKCLTKLHYKKSPRLA
jgi:hypothetical protein